MHLGLHPIYLHNPTITWPHPHSPLLPRNSVLDTNPPIADNNITSRGSSWLWAVTALHGFLFLVVLGLTIRKKHRNRVFHYLSLGILLFPTIAYFTMASNLGATPVEVEFRKDGLQGRTREVFWVRFVGELVVLMTWGIWSLITLSLLLLTVIGWSTILATLALTILYSVMLLCGALTPTSYKWGFFFFGLLSYFLLIIQFLQVARPWASRFNTTKYYFPLTGYMLFYWGLYPLAWALSEGGNVIENDSECVFYGVLDVFSKGVFALILLWTTRGLNLGELGLYMFDHGRVNPGYGTRWDPVAVRGAGAGPGAAAHREKAGTTMGAVTGAGTATLEATGAGTRTETGTATGTGTAAPQQEADSTAIGGGAGTETGTGTRGYYNGAPGNNSSVDPARGGITPTNSATMTTTQV